MLFLPGKRRLRARRVGRQIGAKSLNSNKKETKSARGEKARAKLKRAALARVERDGYHRMRINDVTSEAGVAAGLFYHYFDDLKSLTMEVLTDFVAEFQNIQRIEKDVEKGDWYGRIYAHNLIVVQSYAARPGLMRCLLQLADEEPEFNAYLQSAFTEQLGWLVKLIPKLFPESGLSEQQALMVIYTLSGSSEALLREYYINRNPALVAEQLTVEQVAELLATTFYRGLFLANPPIEKLDYTAKLKDLVRRA